MALDLRRVLYLDLPVPKAGIRTGSIFQQTNLNEFLVICWNAQHLHQSFVRPAGHTVTLSQYQKFMSDFNSKWAEISNWVSHGHVLVIFNFDLHPVTYSDQNRSTNADLSELPPFKGLKLTAVSGELVAPAPSFSVEFSAHASLFRYHYIVNGADIIPLFLTSTTRPEDAQTVGAVLRWGKGAIIFSPPLKEPQHQGIPDYLEAATRVADLLRPETTDAAPSWTNDFLSKAEVDAAVRIDDIEQKVASLQSARMEALEKVESEKRLKILYSGYDRSLVAAVRQALTELGLKVADGPHPRADLLVWDGGKRLAAAEVKGLAGTAREFNLGQTHRWVSDVNAAFVATAEELTQHPELQQYLDRLTSLGLEISQNQDIRCHGLMIIGTFRDTPLNERLVDSFPHQLMGLIARSKFSAMTGLDLYCLLQQVREASVPAERAIDMLFSQAGVVPAQNWDRAITTAARATAEL